MEGYKLIAGRLPIGRINQSLGLLDEGTLLIGILLKGIFHTFEILGLATKEIIASSTEALKDLHVHLLWSETNGLPLRLYLDNLLGMLLPIATALVLFSSNGLYLLTKCSLTSQIVFLLGTYTLEVLLVALVDN